ncbi:MAG: hypothetical protein DRP66_11730 [Planctomycetota bacterium]|nr:MAG: hypothetical protein DRP66_11730 [Planctomycetota bacterium]
MDLSGSSSYLHIAITSNFADRGLGGGGGGGGFFGPAARRDRGAGGLGDLGGFGGGGGLMRLAKSRAWRTSGDISSESVLAVELIFFKASTKLGSSRNFSISGSPFRPNAPTKPTRLTHISAARKVVIFRVVIIILSIYRDFTF